MSMKRIAFGFALSAVALAAGAQTAARKGYVIQLADPPAASYDGTITEVVDQDGTRRYLSLAGGRETVVRITPGLCQDVMSGAGFGAEVVVTREGEEYRGCGVFLGGERPGE